jgi:hypothetical protein
MDLNEIGWECVDWIHLTLGRDQWQALSNVVQTFRFQKGQGISSLAEGTISFSKRTLLHGVM